MKTICSSAKTLTAILGVAVMALTACDRRHDVDRNGIDDRQRTAGEELDDKTLTAKVKSALEADSVKYPDVQVAAYKGVIQLSGFVDTGDHKSRASDVAKNIVGVRKVENSITVKEGTKP
jgi:hyperosmotically inducible protein